MTRRHKASVVPISGTTEVLSMTSFIFTIPQHYVFLYKRG
nr:MAG TPA: hypothetical protein [Caudoviricetes sp.]